MNCYLDTDHELEEMLNAMRGHYEIYCEKCVQLGYTCAGAKSITRYKNCIEFGLYMKRCK